MKPTSKRPMRKKMKTDDKLTHITENLKVLTSFMMDQTNNLKFSPAQRYASTPPEPTTMIPANRRGPPLDGGNSAKIGGMWTLKHEISSPKFYEILIKTELKGDTALVLKNFYNHIKMCINAVTRLREDLLPGYQLIKRHSEFAEYFIPDRDHPSYSWNFQIYISLVHSLLVAITNDTCVKSSMAPQAYNFFRTHAHEISGWAIFSILLHSHYPHLGGMNGDVQSDIATLAFKNGEQLEDFHGRILRLQQRIMLSGEMVSPTKLLFQSIKAFSKSYKIRAFIVPKMTGLITFLDNNRKSTFYIGLDIHGIYSYLEMIGTPTTLTTSGQRSHNFSPSYSINNDTATLQPVIADLCTRQKSICELCVRIGHEADSCIIRGPKFFTPSLRIKINQFSALRGDEKNQASR